MWLAIGLGATALVLIGLLVLSMCMAAGRQNKWED